MTATGMRRVRAARCFYCASIVTGPARCWPRPPRHEQSSSVRERRESDELSADELRPVDSSGSWCGRAMDRRRMGNAGWAEPQRRDSCEVLRLSCSLTSVSVRRNPQPRRACGFTPQRPCRARSNGRSSRFHPAQTHPTALTSRVTRRLIRGASLAWFSIEESIQCDLQSKR